MKKYLLHFISILSITFLLVIGFELTVLNPFSSLFVDSGWARFLLPLMFGPVFIIYYFFSTHLSASKTTGLLFLSLFFLVVIGEVLFFYGILEMIFNFIASVPAVYITGLFFKNKNYRKSG